MSERRARSISRGSSADDRRRCFSRFRLAPLGSAHRLPYRAPARVCEAFNLIAGTIAFASALPLPFLIDGRALLFWDDYVILDRVAAWIILCTSIVYFLASIYAVGYMRLLARGGTPLSLLRAVCRLRPDHARRPADEQRRHLLDRDRTDHARQHLPRRLRTRCREHGSGVEIHHGGIGRNQPRAARHRAVLLGRQLRPRADLSDDLGSRSNRRRRG